jgi:hypothetical protein
MKLRQNVGNVQSHLPMVHWPRARSGANQSLQFWINTVHKYMHNHCFTQPYYQVT